MRTGHRMNALSRKVLAACTAEPQSMGEILAKLPDEDKDKVAHRVHQLATQGFLQNHRSVRSYGGLYSLQVPLAQKREGRVAKPLNVSFPLYDVWR